MVIFDRVCCIRYILTHKFRPSDQFLSIFDAVDFSQFVPSVIGCCDTLLSSESRLLKIQCPLVKNLKYRQFTIVKYDANAILSTFYFLLRKIYILKCFMLLTAKCRRICFCFLMKLFWDYVICSHNSFH